MTARIAGGLAERFDLKQGDRAAILMGLSWDQVQLTLALSWLGLTIIPVNTRLGGNDMQGVVALAEPDVLFWDQAHERRAAEVVQATAVALSVMVDASLLTDLAREGSRPCAPWSDAHVAAIIFTGGTTGAPKGVMLTQGVMRAMAYAFAHEMAYGADTIYLQSMPVFHVGGLGQLLGVTAKGGCHVFDPESSPAATYSALRNERVNTIAAVPTSLAFLLDSPLRDDALLAQIRAVAYGAAAISQALLERLLEALPNAGFRQFYGQTETAAPVTVLRRDYHVLKGPNAGHLTSCGQPCDGVVVETHDASGNPTPAGTPGEVVVRAEFLPPGYWRDPERTRELYRNDWLHTGDIGVLDTEGFLTIVDRLKDVIITGGENVFCTEVENVIARHPDVAECAVIGLPDELWGEAVHAVVVLRPGAGVDESGLRAFCAEGLGSFKRPKTIEIATQPLPLSGVGKVMKTVLRDRWLARQH
jgi:acyl-CoA synthetase (AMP-forming)/AMP-acid ligase II